MTTDNIDDIPKWSTHFPRKPTKDNASKLRKRRTVQTKGSYLDEYGKHLPKRQYVSDPVKSKRPVLTEAAFHTVHSRPAPFGSIVQDNGSKWAQSIDISFLAWHGQPANIRLHATGWLVRHRRDAMSLYADNLMHYGHPRG